MKLKSQLLKLLISGLFISSSLTTTPVLSANNNYKMVEKSELIGTNLKSYIANLEDHKALIDVEIALVRDLEADTKENLNTEMSISEDGEITVIVNNKELDASELNSFYEKEKKERKQRREKLRGKSANVANRFVQKMQWLKDNNINAQIEGGKRTLSVQITAREVEKILKKVPELILGMELKLEASNNINSAMISARTNRALTLAHPVGQGVGIYVSELEGCPDRGFSNGFLEPYLRLGGTGENHSRLVMGIIRHVSPNAHLYCQAPFRVPYVSELDGVSGYPEILVANISNGTFTFLEYGTRDRDWDNLIYDHRVAAFVAAGNNNSGVFEVESPGKAYNIITVGSYNDATDVIASDSSYVATRSLKRKPEISAPGVDIAAVGLSNSGTSLASPHAAGMAANLMSLMPALKGRPAQLKAMILAGATKNIGGTTTRVGVGGMDFVSTYYNGYGGERDTHGEYYQENPVFFTPINTWNRFGNPKAKRMRIVISWLNDGDYAYSRRHLGNREIAKDFDIRLYKNGSQIASSRSRDNAFEIIDVELTGENYSDSYAYTIEQVRNSSSDTRNILGYWINFYDD